MSNQIAPITERQLELITRAHFDADGLIEPLLELKGGAKLKMIASLAQRRLIEQTQGQWRITRVAIVIIKGEAKPEDVLAPFTTAANKEPEADVMPTIATEPVTAPATEATPVGRCYSKQSLVIEMLKRPEGVTIAQVCDVTGWQAHTVRGTFAGVLKKKLNLTIVSDKPEGGQRVYRIA